MSRAKASAHTRTLKKPPARRGPGRGPAVILPESGRRREVDLLDDRAVTLTQRDGSYILLDTLNALLEPEDQFEVLDMIRELIPIVDSAINGCVDMTGRFDVLCQRPAEQVLADDFLERVPCGTGNVGVGYFDYLDMLRDSTLHYGRAVSEVLPTAGFDGVEKLKVPDTRTFRWKLIDGAWTLVQHPGRPEKQRVIADRTFVDYWTYKLVQGRPDGRSLLWKLDLPARVLVTILAAIGAKWERFGNPNFLVLFTTAEQLATLDPKQGKEQLRKKVDAIAREFTKALKAKAETGKNYDMVMGLRTGANNSSEKLEVKVLGEPAALLESSEDYGVVARQILAKMRVPSWMAGWRETGDGMGSTLSEQELAVYVAAIEARREDEIPNIRHDFDLMFALAGVGQPDYEIAWEDVNLFSSGEQAKTQLYRAQAESIEIANLVSMHDLGLDPQIPLREQQIDDRIRRAAQQAAAQFLRPGGANGNGSGDSEEDPQPNGKRPRTLRRRAYLR